MTRVKLTYPKIPSSKNCPLEKCLVFKKVDEGVVCKGVSKTTNNIWMVKIKTNSYRSKLKQAFQDDWGTYWE